MKEILLIFIEILLICIFFTVLSINNSQDDILAINIERQRMLQEMIITDTNKIDIKIIDWHTFINAMMYIESKGNPLAVGKTNDAGVLQLTPIYVKEANRVLGENKFTLADRFDKYKSIEMFSIINEKYNPERSFYKAMRLHNPNAPDSYRKAILTQYYKLRNK